MTVCPKYEKTLLSDVTGELDDESRFSWQSHLKRCASCRQEKEKLLSLMAQIKTGSAAPTLSAVEANTMVSNINRQLAGRTKMTPAFPAWIQNYRKLIPMAAAACLLLAILGVLWSNEHIQPFGHQAMNSPAIEKAMSPEDIDIIKNYDLLREFESLEKLVHVIDSIEPNTPSSLEPNNSHGMIINEKNILYS